jgi:phage gpG-like protein
VPLYGLTLLPTVNAQGVICCKINEKEMDAANFGKLSSMASAALNHYFVSVGPQNAIRETLRFIDDNFRLQGWQGAGFQKWQKTKRGGTILVKTGALRRGFNYEIRGNGDVYFYNNIIYASIHNVGGNITRFQHSETFVRNRVTSGKRKGRFTGGTTPGKGFILGEYAIKMPCRQFAPTEDSPSPVLEKAIIGFLEKDIKAILTL